MNQVKSTSLFAALAATAALVGFVVAGAMGMLFAAGSVVVMLLLGQSVSEELLMRIRGGRRVGPRRAPELHALVATLAERAGVPTPRIYLLPQPVANALTLRTGGPQDEGAVAVSRGTLHLLGPAELEAVLAHEIAHLANGDMEMLQLTAVLSRSTLSLLRIGTWVAVFGVLLTGGGMGRAALLAMLAMVLPPVIEAMRTALSRARELAADKDAARLTGQPLALAAALTKLDDQAGWFARIVRARPAPPWLQSHPPTPVRVARLIALDKQWRTTSPG